ncbi:MAG: polymerase sigma factor RpoE [Myxococcaceae bacterium]|nr:polymerase sigma factor RpoE [Myxococcaceae bacterium]
MKKKLSTNESLLGTLPDVNTDPANKLEEQAYTPTLLDACRRGEQAALAQVFRREAPYLERVLFRVLGPNSELEDLLQLTLEQAIRAFPSFRGEASVRTWLTRIAVRSAMHHIKHPSQRRRVALEVIDGGLLAVSNSRPAHEAEARARLRILYEHLERLDAKHRAAFVLFQVEGRAMEEVAALMDASLSATKSRVMWARRKLFARLLKDPRAREWAHDLTGGQVPSEGSDS